MIRNLANKCREKEVGRMGVREILRKGGETRREKRKEAFDGASQWHIVQVSLAARLT
jgi:hypothetical protein